MARWWMPFARAIGGAVAALPPEKREAENDPQAQLQEWQKRAWRFYKTLGEIHYGASFYARMLSGIKLEIQELTGPAPDDTGQPGDKVDADVREWKTSNDANLNGVIKGLENSRGGLGQLQAEFGRLWFVQGEALLCCTLDGLGTNPDGSPITNDEGGIFDERWEMLSTAECSYDKSSKSYSRRGRPNQTPKRIPETDPDNPLPDTMIAYRLYHRDPEWSGMADSSIRAVLDDCEELTLLKRAIRNMAKNRGAGNGILMLPASMQGQMVDRGDGKMIPENAKAIYDALTEPIKDENAASAVTPVILFTPDNVTQQNAFHIDLRGAALYKETGLRDECIRRIAIGLDMPPEALLGTASANHWTAWQIDDAAWTNHGAPVATEFVGQLTAALLAPVARAAGKDSTACRIWFDATEVVQDPDRARAAAEAFDRLAISFAAYRRETGWEEEDAPDDAEWEKRVAAQAAPPGKTAEKQKAEPQQGQASMDRIVGMAEACVERCRELAGSRLRSKLQAAEMAPNLQVRMRGAANADLAWKIGTREIPANVRIDPDALVAGAGSVFLNRMIRLGLEPSHAESIVRRTEEHAAHTLFDEDPGQLPREILGLCSLRSISEATPAMLA